MDRTILESVLRTLNATEVRGEENLDHMLGCIRALRYMLQEEDAENADNHNGSGTNA